MGYKIACERCESELVQCQKCGGWELDRDMYEVEGGQSAECDGCRWGV